jgi:UDP-N-acetylglucosamine 2-epimerase (non-hydrolysing)
MASVIYVAGARPNFMKVAPILRAARGGPFESVLVHTGQHYDHAMSGVFFEQLGIPEPDVHLEIGSATHGVQTGRIMAAFEEYVLARTERPRGIVVVGDVNSTMACALVGAKLGIPVAHVEAGLRSFDRTMPEEINRIVTDQVSDVLLVSEPAGLANLAREGVSSGRIDYVGNVMIDSIVEQLPIALESGTARRFGVENEPYALVTLHRPSNVDEAITLKAHVDFLVKVSNQMKVIFAVHPRTEARLQEFGLQNLVSSSRIAMSGALGYHDFVGLLAGATVAITDSGGIQEESTFLGIPCLTLRTNTERPITVESGVNTLVGHDFELALRLLGDVTAGRYKQGVAIEGWDGRAAERIVASLHKHWAPDSCIG